MDSELDPKITIVQRYMTGQLTLDEAASQIHELQGTGLGLSFGYDSVSPEEAEKLEALFGRLFWLGMRDANPKAIPPNPFGAAEFRMLRDRLDKRDGEE
jgi:hypothetical protein